jgi:hypothetical protein
MARMWAVGVSHPQAEQVYRSVDACALDSALTAIESDRDAARSAAGAYLALTLLLRDSVRTIASPLSPDTTERVLPGSRYGRQCIARILEDRAGVAVLTPLILARKWDNIYARDLHARDTLLLAAHPDRPVYLLRPSSPAVDAVPHFYPVSRDSIWAAARADQGLSAVATGARMSASRVSERRPDQSR